MINFKEITNANIWKVCTLEPFEEQKDFVAENIQRRKPMQQETRAAMRCRWQFIMMKRLSVLS